MKCPLGVAIYADDTALPCSSHEGLLSATNSTYEHLNLFGLSASSCMLDHWAKRAKRRPCTAQRGVTSSTRLAALQILFWIVGGGGRIPSTTWGHFFIATYQQIITTLMLESRFTPPLERYLRDHIFSTRDVSKRGSKGTGGDLAVLLYGCESWCLMAESISRLRKWHNKRIRKICTVAICQMSAHQISSANCRSARVSSRLSDIWQDTLRSGLVTLRTCLNSGYPPRGSRFCGYKK